MDFSGKANISIVSNKTAGAYGFHVLAPSKGKVFSKNTSLTAVFYFKWYFFSLVV